MYLTTQKKMWADHLGEPKQIVIITSLSSSDVGVVTSGGGKNKEGSVILTLDPYYHNFFRYISFWYTIGIQESPIESNKPEHKYYVSPNAERGYRTKFEILLG